MRAALPVLAIGVAFFSSTARAEDVKKGADIYAERCSLCHVEEGQGQGPNLKSVVGRKAATAPDFPYTDALKTSGLTWTPANLDTFLTAPTKLVPGTAMPIEVPEARDRADLIAFLASHK